MSTTDSVRSAAIRAVLLEHIATRSKNELTETEAASSLLEGLFTQLKNAADLVEQIQIATHIIKGAHPKARGSNLNIDCASLPQNGVLGSHVLGNDAEADATGNGSFNAKVLEVYQLLRTKYQDKRVIDLLRSRDADAVSALSDDPKEAAILAEKLSQLGLDRDRLSSHTLAKQIYWFVGDDPHDDTSYHLLAPLYPTSLVQKFYQILQDDRFSELAKEANTARKAEEWHPHPVRKYPDLAVQNLGGEKQHNVSQLNSKRRGQNFLLASLPPVWHSPEIRPVYGVASLFDVFEQRKEVRRLTKDLRHFLEGDPTANRKTRRRRETLFEEILDEFIQLTATLHRLAPGWARDSRCQLSEAQRAWLDLEKFGSISEDFIDNVASDFAKWLNGKLRDPLPMGDAEYLHWRNRVTCELDEFAAIVREQANG